MRDIRVKNRLAIFEFKRQRFAGMTIRRRNDRVGMQRGRNSRKRRRHPNTRSIARLRYEQSLGVKTSKSVEHGRFVDVDLARYIQGIRNASGLSGYAIDREFNFRFELAAIPSQ
jgi:hypothetical protein